MVPEASDAVTFWEHVYRYRFAAKLIKGKRVLDIACGEGYGTASLMRSGAESVIGIDISEEACLHARHKYGVDARQGDAENIPLPDNSVDVVVSFETIEHLPNPGAFLDQCVRVLSNRGVLIISTPVRNTYREAGRSSTFHCSELSETELSALLNARFASFRLYGQQPTRGHWVSMHPLALTSSPWLRIRGAWRLRERILTETAGHLTAEVDDMHRDAVVDLILSKDKWGCSLVNPYHVARLLPGSGEFPTYLVAVARLAH